MGVHVLRDCISAQAQAACAMAASYDVASRCACHITRACFCQSCGLLMAHVIARAGTLSLICRRNQRTCHILQAFPPTHTPNHRNAISRASTLPHTTPIHPCAIVMISFRIHKARPAPSMRSGARPYVRFAAWDMAVRHHPPGISICARGRACPAYPPAPESRARPISPGRTARTAPRLPPQSLWLCPWWSADICAPDALS